MADLETRAWKAAKAIGAWIRVGMAGALLGWPLLAGAGVQVAAPIAPPAPATPVPAESPLRAEIGSGDRIGAADLAKALEKPGAPLVLQVGPRSMFDQAHILGAEYAGAGSTEQGLAALKTRVAKIEKDRWIVVYCGCCPWEKCPNIRPALNTLRGLGFTHVQALFLPQNFGADWVSKGLPTEQ